MKSVILHAFLCASIKAYVKKIHLYKASRSSSRSLRKRTSDYFVYLIMVFKLIVQMAVSFKLNIAITRQCLSHFLPLFFCVLSRRYYKSQYMCSLLLSHCILKSSIWEIFSLDFLHETATSDAIAAEKQILNWKMPFESHCSILLLQYEVIVY